VHLLVYCIYEVLPKNSWEFDYLKKFITVIPSFHHLLRSSTIFCEFPEFLGSTSCVCVCLYIIVMSIDDNSVINNNYGRLQDVTLLFKIVWWAHKGIALKLIDSLGKCPQKGLPAQIYGIDFLCCLPFWVAALSVWEVNCGFILGIFLKK
jgi:hypothetical protein